MHSPECRARFQDIVDNEAAQTAAASASEPNVETPGQAAGAAAGRAAPEDVNMRAAESSAAQPTSSVVRTLEAEHDGSAKRQRLMAGMPILHETDEDVNVGRAQDGCFVGGDARRSRTVDSAGRRLGQETVRSQE